MQDLGQVACDAFRGDGAYGNWELLLEDTKDRWRSAAKAAIRELLDTAEEDAFAEGIAYWSVVFEALRKLADVAPGQEPTAPSETPAAEPAPAESADSRQLLLEHAKLTIQFLRSMATVTTPECMRVAMADRAQCLEAAVEAFEKPLTQGSNR